MRYQGRDAVLDRDGLDVDAACAGAQGRAPHAGLTESCATQRPSLHLAQPFDLLGQHRSGPAHSSPAGLGSTRGQSARRGRGGGLTSVGPGAVSRDHAEGAGRQLGDPRWRSATSRSTGTLASWSASGRSSGCARGPSLASTPASSGLSPPVTIAGSDLVGVARSSRGCRSGTPSIFRQIPAFSGRWIVTAHGSKKEGSCGPGWIYVTSCCDSWSRFEGFGSRRSPVRIRAPRLNLRDPGDPMSANYIR